MSVSKTKTTPAPAPRKRRRRRRRSSQLLSQRLITEVNQKKRQFLRDVSTMLTDALGFEVKVTLVRPKLDLSPDQRRASRMTKAQARRQMADSMQAPVSIPVRRHRDGSSSFTVGKLLNDPLDDL